MARPVNRLTGKRRPYTLKESAELADAGKRMADVINGLLAFNNPFELKNKWLAFTLQDGSWHDKAIYDSLPGARKRADPWKHCFFAFRASLGGIRARDCEIFLDVHRQARENNVLQSNPDANADLIIPVKAGDTLRANQRGDYLG